MLNYDEEEYARARLAGTIVQRTKLGKKKAILVQDIIDGSVMHLVLSTGAGDVCPVSELDITPVPLGYINMGGKATTYMARRPMRKDWRQGLRAENAVCVDGNYSFGHVSHKNLAACIEGVYPNYKQVIGKIVRNPEPNGHSMAFSREFAIDVEHHLWYKTIHVGYVEDDGSVKYANGFEWVDDTFQEMVNG